MESKDIIKALECCSISDCFDKCKKCFYAECDSDKGCIAELCEDSLDLIKNQQAEIEKLKKARDYYKKNRDEYQDKVMFIANLCDEIQAELETAKTEAYKEFADRLKEKEEIVKNPFDCTMELAVYVEDIDKTFNELTDRKED